MELTFNKPMEFKLNKARIIISPEDDTITLLKNSEVHEISGLPRLAYENKTYTIDGDLIKLIMFIDKLVTNEQRELDIIRGTWKNNKNESLTDHTIIDILGGLDYSDDEVYTEGGYELEGEQSVETINNIKETLNEVEYNPDKDIQDTEDELSKALVTIFKELNKPKELSKESIKLLKSIDSKISKAIDSINKTPKVRELQRATTGKTYTEVDFNREITGQNLNKLKLILKIKRALILAGVPGTGKTTIMRALASVLTGNTNSKYVEFISFNQHTSYSDFVSGLTSVEGVWLKTFGALSRVCKAAIDDPDNNYYLLIDELSRGNTEAIFGELMTAIEQRGIPIVTNNGDTLIVPKNLYIIATMNITDKSTSRLDVATADRFGYIEVEPQTRSILERPEFKDVEYKEELKSILELIDKINEEIRKDSRLGEQFEVGPRSLFSNISNKEEFKLAIEYDLLPSIDRRIRNMTNKNSVKSYIEKIREIING